MTNKDKKIWAPQDKVQSWERRQFREKRSQLLQIQERISRLEGRVQKITAKFQSKYQERIKPYQDELDKIGKRIQVVNKTFTDRLNDAVKDDRIALEKAKQLEARLSKQLLQFAGAELANEKLDRDSLTTEDSEISTLLEDLEAVSPDADDEEPDDEEPDDEDLEESTEEVAKVSANR